MDQVKQSFQESEFFKLIANYPAALAETAIKAAGDLSQEQSDAITEAFMEIGFHLTAAASASYRLNHAVDIMRNQGNMGPEVRYMITEAASELHNAVTLNEPIVRVRDFLEKLGEDLNQWQVEAPDNIPDDGIKIEYVRNYNTVANGRLTYFRYKHVDNQTVITDIPCIYDEELFAYMPLTNNPMWKYINEPTDTNESIQNPESTADTNAEENTGSENSGSPESE